MAKPKLDATLNEDLLKLLEYEAVNEGWFERYRGWAMLNRLRTALGRKTIQPIDEPSANYFESDGEVR